MEDLYTKLELFSEKFITLLFVFLFVVQAILTSLLLCLVLLAAAHNVSRICVVSSGLIRSLPFHGTAGLDEGDLAVWAGSPPPPSLLTTSDDDAMKPLYNSRSQNVDEFALSPNIKLMSPWTSEEWRDKVSLFSDIFSDMMRRGVFEACATALCIGAGKGHDVLAFVQIGISNSGESGLVGWPPLVVEGDMHCLPFAEHTFDFEFSNMFDQSLFTPQLAMEVARTLKPGGCVAICLMRRTSCSHEESNTLPRKSCHEESNTFPSIDALFALFEGFEVVHVGDINAFRGLDTEIILRKPFATGWTLKSS